MSLAHDLRYAIRRLRNSPGFTAIAVASLGLGIGANTAIFSVVDAVFFKPTPVRDPARVVTIMTRHEDYRFDSGFDYPDLLKFRRDCASQLDIAGYDTLTIDVGTLAGTERIEGALVSGNYFEMLGVTPILGRTFLPEEDRTPSAYPVVVIGGALWESSFRSDLGILGKAVKLNGRDFTIIGVAPSRFRGTVATSAPEIWVPIMMWDGIEPLPAAFRKPPKSDILRGGYGFLNLVGRLKPGVSLLAAQAALRGSQDEVGRNRFPLTLTPLPAARLPREYEGSMPLLMGVLFGVVGLLLLIACANVSSLVIGRAVARQKEIAIRMALGARRLQIARELLAESLALALAGGGAGILIALWTVGAFEAWRPLMGIPLPPGIGIDLRVLAFALLASLLSGAAVALLAGLRATAGDAASAMKEMPSGPADRSSLSLRNLLVVGQVALSLALLAGSGLLLKTFRNVQSIPIGFDPHNLILLSADFTRHGFSDAAAMEAYRRLLERIQNLPGVESAALAQFVPLASSSGAWNYKPYKQGAVQMDQNVVSPGYFRTMGIPVLRGRDLTPQDAAGARKVTVLNETYVGVMFKLGIFKSQDPIGQMGDDAAVVVGVVKDNKNGSLRTYTEPWAFVPYSQEPFPKMSLVVRTKADPRSMLAPVIRAAREIDPALPASSVALMSEQIDNLLWQPRIASLMVGAFALVAALLAMVGVYGAVSFDVSRRVHEIGIRMALGAARSDVLRMVVARGALLGAIGAAVGVCAALGLTRLIATMLYGVSPTDPAVFAAVAALLVGVAALAGYLPARRAAGVDPIEALRYQ